MNLVDVLLNNVRRYPGKMALVCGDTRLTYQAFNERCNRLTHVLSRFGLGKGDHFALFSKNCHRHFEMFFAAAKTGTALVPLNYRLSARELAYIINDSESKILFFAKEYAPMVEIIQKELKRVKSYVCTDDSIIGISSYEELLSHSDPSEPDSASIVEEDVVTILYTSGTTGYPKGAMISHRNRVMDMIQQVVDFEYIEPDDTHLIVGPLYHVGALANSHAHFYMGCTMVVLDQFNPQRIFELIEKEKLRSLWGAPTMIQMLIDFPEAEKFDRSSLKTISYAGSPMPVEILKKAIRFFGENLFLQFYGMTETGPTITRLRRKDHVLQGTEKQLKRLSSAGVESQHVHVRIVDHEGMDLAPNKVGEIVVKSDGIMQGYWKKPEETEQAIKKGWFYTGDMGYMDEDRYVYIVDRKKDMIISGGENVYSAEVENTLYMHPAVSEAAAIGVPDKKWGETVKAIVVLKPGIHATEEEIIDHCKKNLASYKKPTSVEFEAELPKSSSGKVLKWRLRELYGKN